MLQAAQLPSSHLGLDCDQILASSLPTRHEIVESTVGRLAGPGKVQAGLLTALRLARDCLRGDWDSLLHSASLAALVLALVILASAGGRAPSATSRPLETLPAGPPARKVGSVDEPPEGSEPSAPNLAPRTSYGWKSDGSWGPSEGSRRSEYKYASTY